MGLIRNKKGVIFTILAIVITFFFSIYFSADIGKPLDHKTALLETRIRVLNDYMGNFYSYANGVGSITGYSALQGVIEDIRNTGQYNPNFETEFAYCINISNLTSTKTCPGMENKSITYYLDKIKDIGLDELKVNSSYIIHGINTTQTADAFSIEVVINLSLIIVDKFANLSDTRIVISSVSIENLYDPIYLLNATINQTNHTIKKTSLRKKEGDWNQINLQQIYYNHEYRKYKDAVSFINRIKGNFSPNIFGIESFVNHSDPAVAALITSNHSMVDYLFWQNVTLNCTDPAEVVEINSSIISPAGFQLDEPHRLSFNISSSDTNFTCPQT